MGTAVISDLVTLVYHTLYKLRTAFYIIKRHIERCRNLLFLQNIQYFSGTAVFIALVKRQADRPVVFAEYESSAV